MKKLLIVIALTIIISASALSNEASKAFEPGKLSFSVKVKKIETNYSIMSLFILPGEDINFEITTKDNKLDYRISFNGDPVDKKSPFKWNITAPKEKGLYRLSINRPDTNEEMKINIFVLAPYDELNGEYLNGYRIGKYPTKIFKSLPVYKPPIGFVEITEDLLETNLTPHFKLSQFLCKQESSFPKYSVIRTVLLLKLELILQKVNEKGFKAETFNIFSSFRTPYYNKAIGNVKYSRHQWGDAADFFIDENPKDGMMDDLNKDGKINWKDAALIYDIIDEMYGKNFYERFVGGLGRYKKTSNHGPFVHTDVRGYRARWGD